MRSIRPVAILALVFAAVLFLAPSESAALPGIKDKLKKKAEDELKKKTEQTETPQAEETPSEDPAAAEAEDPGKGAWVNYDFIPGDEVIFFDDFTHDAVGNFPQRLELLDGNMEIAEYKGRRYLRATTAVTFEIPLPDVLPSKFTLEFDMWVPDRWGSVTISGATPKGYSGESFPTEIDFSPWDLRAGLRYAGPKDGEALTSLPESLVTQLLHCRVLGDGKYLKVYVNETRVANFPNADFYRSNAIQFEVRADTRWPVFLADLRVAKSEKTLYDALVADGRVATHGILFDTGSDRIRPESTPTLKEIGTMLKDHADLRLRIEGHTDNVGDDASNQTLSEKRAAAVRDYLVKEFGVDGARLTAEGFGETKPVASNDTPEGRQNNRRVELVKL